MFLNGKIRSSLGRSKPKLRKHIYSYFSFQSTVCFWTVPKSLVLSFGKLQITKPQASLMGPVWDTSSCWNFTEIVLLHYSPSPFLIESNGDLVTYYKLEMNLQHVELRQSTDPRFSTPLVSNFSWALNSSWRRKRSWRRVLWPVKGNWITSFERFTRLPKILPALNLIDSVWKDRNNSDLKV